MRLNSTLSVGVVTLWALVGCADASKQDPSAAAPPAPPTPILLVPLSFDQWQQELASLKGRMVVVDFWATWCIPCLERFPHTVALAKRYRPRGVVFLSMCLDDRTDEEALAFARQFLSEQSATFPNYLMDESVTTAFDKLDLLGIPAVFVYDASGELRFRLTGDDPNHQFTDRDVEQAIETLLAGSGAT